MSEVRTRLVFPSERHVERAIGEGGITRARLRERLLDALAADVRFADAEHARLALAAELPPIAARDPLLSRIARTGGASWLRTVDAVDGAIATLRAANVGPDELEAIVSGGLAARARLLREAMGAVDARLAQ
jgi:hypothetical protein